MSRNHQGHVTQTQNDAIKICGQRSDPRLDRTAHTFCVIWIVNKIYCVIIQCCRQFIRLMAGDNVHLAGARTQRGLYGMGDQRFSGQGQQQLVAFPGAGRKTRRQHDGINLRAHLKISCFGCRSVVL